MRTRHIMEITSRLCNRYLRDGGDLAILPVGSVEELGPHLPVGGRCFVAEAFAKMMAHEADGLHLPVVPYTPITFGGTRPGSIPVPDSTVNEYLRALMDDLYEQGFRRIVLVTFLDYARYYLPQEMFEDTSAAAAGIHLGEALDEACADTAAGIDDVIAAALEMLGMDAVLEKCLAKNAELAASGESFGVRSEAYANIAPHASIAYRASEGEYLYPPKEGLSAKRGLVALKKAAADSADALSGLAAYRDYLSRRGARGFERGSWYRHLEDE